jgi:hypothetical protein
MTDEPEVDPEPEPEPEPEPGLELELDLDPELLLQLLLATYGNERLRVTVVEKVSQRSGLPPEKIENALQLVFEYLLRTARSSN